MSAALISLLVTGIETTAAVWITVLLLFSSLLLAWFAVGVMAAAAIPTAR